MSGIREIPCAPTNPANRGSAHTPEKLAEFIARHHDASIAYTAGAPTTVVSNPDAATTADEPVVRVRNESAESVTAHQVSLLLPDPPGWPTLPSAILLAVCAA